METKVCVSFCSQWASRNLSHVFPGGTQEGIISPRLIYSTQALSGTLISTALESHECQPTVSSGNSRIERVIKKKYRNPYLCLLVFI